MASPLWPEAVVEWETVNGGGNVYGIIAAIKRALVRAYGPEDGQIYFELYQEKKENYTSYSELVDDVENWVTVD